MDQPGEVQAWHQKTGAAGEDRQHGRLQPTDRKQADRREESQSDVGLRIAGDARFSQPLAVVSRKPLGEPARATSV
jgi:hypothetical protein